MPDNDSILDVSEDTKETAAERQGHYYLGERLKPLSLGRQLAIQRIQYSASEVESAMIIVFLCTLESKEVDRLTRRPQDREEFHAKMIEWAEKKGVTISQSPVYEGEELVGMQYDAHPTRELIRVANEIEAELEASSGRPERIEGDKGENPPPNG